MPYHTNKFTMTTPAGAYPTLRGPPAETRLTVYRRLLHKDAVSVSCSLAARAPARRFSHKFDAGEIFYAQSRLVICVFVGATELSNHVYK